MHYLRSFVVAVILAVPAVTAVTAGSPANVEVKIENTLTESRGTVITALVRVTNLTSRVLDFVKITCAYQDDSGRTLDTGTDGALDLQPGATTFVKPKVYFQASMTKTECFADFVDP